MSGILDRVDIHRRTDDMLEKVEGQFAGKSKGFREERRVKFEICPIASDRI